MRLDPVSTAAFAATRLTEPTQHGECAFTIHWDNAWWAGAREPVRPSIYFCE